MTDTPTVQYALHDGVATLTMDDGKANVMSLSLLQQLHNGFDRAETDDADVVLLQGRPGMFSAGYDLGMFQQPPEELFQTMRAGGELVLKVFEYSRPVVIAGTGHAIAQGGFLLLAADLRIAADGDFKIGLNEVALGLTMPHYGVEIARARLTTSGFQRATLTGALFPPTLAQELGFVDERVPPEQVGAHALAQAKALCLVDRTAHAATKARVRGEALAAIRFGIETELTMPAA